MYFIIFFGLIIFFLWLYFDFTSRFDIMTGKKVYRSGIYMRDKNNV